MTPLKRNIKIYISSSLFFIKIGIFSKNIKKNLFCQIFVINVHRVCIQKGICKNKDINMGHFKYLRKERMTETEREKLSMMM